MIALVVLSDGETYSSLDGAKVVYVNEDEHERLHAYSGGEGDVFAALPKDRVFEMTDESESDSPSEH
jgi:hypothetical protein